MWPITTTAAVAPSAAITPKAERLIQKVLFELLGVSHIRAGFSENAALSSERLAVSSSAGVRELIPRFEPRN